jgi:hypothetical protein
VSGAPGAAGQPLSTAPPRREVGELRRARALRWLFAAALVLFLLVGLLGGYGVRHGEVSATGGGYELTVRYPRVTRPGLASVWEVEVRRVDGRPLDGPVTISTGDAWFSIFDENGLDPDPASARSDGEHLVWEIEPVDGASAVTVGYDARVEPGVQLTRRRGETSVLVDGEPVVTVRYRAWVLP